MSEQRESYPSYPPQCRETRKIIDQGVEHIVKIDLLLREGDEGFEDQQADANLTLESIRQALAERPAACGLTEVNGDGHFQCSNCAYDVWVESQISTEPE